MSQRWLKFLEEFGRRGKALPIPADEEDLERLTNSPEGFARYDVLFRLYGPLPGTPWEPYQCPTLFASIDKLDIKPKKLEKFLEYETPRPATAWQWLGPETMVIVDLPEQKTIEVGLLLMQQRAQFVSTFDHWIHAVGSPLSSRAVDPEKLVDAMFTLAPKVYSMRSSLPADAPPVWLCDSRRLGDQKLKPSPGTFDNRYFIDDSILPGIKTLKKAKIQQVVYLNTSINKQPLPDLVPFLVDADRAGIRLFQVGIKDKTTWSKPKPIEKLFKTKLPLKGFRRSDMGGFGKVVPEPSEGGYSSGGGGG